MKEYIKLMPNAWLSKDYEKGWGNGYVVLPNDHPFYGAHYDIIPVSVHGGLTYARHEDNGHDGWCVGFDTVHFGDTAEKWTYNAVLEEAQSLMQQLIDLRDKYTRQEVIKMINNYHSRYDDYEDDSPSEADCWDGDNSHSE
jgi:hypothetical protein